MSLIGTSSSKSTGPQQYTGTSSGYGLTLQGSNKGVNTGTQTTIKDKKELKNLGNVNLKAAKGSTIVYQPEGAANQSSVLETVSGLFSKVAGGDSGSGGGGGGITVNNTPPIGTVQAMGTSSTVKWLIGGALVVGAGIAWKLLFSKK
jgi:hypothetical protein